jgi:hypothetical protein
MMSRPYETEQSAQQAMAWMKAIAPDAEVTYRGPAGTRVPGLAPSATSAHLNNRRPRVASLRLPSPRRCWRLRRLAILLLGTALFGCLIVGCRQPLDRVAYRQACQAYSAGFVTINRSDQYPSLSPALPQFSAGLKAAQLSHNATLTHAFAQLVADVRRVGTLKVGRRVPRKLTASMLVSTTTIVRGCKAHGYPIVYKPVLHI